MPAIDDRQKHGLTDPDQATETIIRSAAVVHHAILPRKLSANAESTLASCLAASGDGSGTLRFCAPVAGSRSIHGCAAALGSLATARAAINCAPTCTKACHGSGPAWRGGAPDPSVRAIAVSPTPMSTSTLTSSTDPASSVTMFVTS